MQSPGKILITSRRAGLFFQYGGWVSNATEAQDFVDQEHAKAACLRWGLIDADIVSEGDAATEQDARFDAKQHAS